MSVTGAPQWLLSAYVRTVLAVGATASREEIRLAGSRLLDRWQEPARGFHNVRHLMDVLARVDELAQETHRPDVVRLAAWYHGAVFDASALVAYARRGGEDEAAGAALARAELASLGVEQAVADRVGELIANLRRHDADDHDVDALALCDADLGTLAVEPQRYRSYREAVRAEYAHIPERDYVESRIAIITRLLARRRLFVSPFSLSWEEPARENLTAELSHLRARWRELDGPPAGGGDDAAGAPSGTDEPTGPRADDAAGEHAVGGDEPADGPTADDAVPPSAPTPADDQPAEDGASEGGASAGPAPETSLSGIEREPDLDPRRRSERRGRRLSRRDRGAPPDRAEDLDSTGSLFRPPPTLPRP